MAANSGLRTGHRDWLVLKFGGTSIDNFAINIAEIVQSSLRERRIAVICSARGKITNLQGTTKRLLRCAREAEIGSDGYAHIVDAILIDHLNAGVDTIKNPKILTRYTDVVKAECDDLLDILKSARFLEEVSARVKDKIISKGEKLSCRFISAVLEDSGVPSQYVDLSNIFGQTKTLDRSFYASAVARLGEKLRTCGEKVPVVTGFFGKVPGGLLDTIGRERNYTDLCAALCAISIHAKEIQIWKKVDGLYSADPHKVPTATLLPSVTPCEAAELSLSGLEVIPHFATMERLIHAGISIRIKSVLNPQNPGTVITSAWLGELNPKLFHTRRLKQGPKHLTAITIKRGIVVLNIHSSTRSHAPSFLRSMFTILGKWNVSIGSISSSEVNVSLALESSSKRDIDGCVTDLSDIGSIDRVQNMAIMTLVGRGLKKTVGIAGRLFSALGDNGINVEMISQGASETSIACVVNEGDADRALNVVHESIFSGLECGITPCPRPKEEYV